MATNLDEVQILHEFIESKFLELYSCIPAKITAVDKLSVGLVNVEPTINTRRSDGSTIEFAEYLEIPLMVYSANAGLAKITMPVKVGDTVTLLYSQRDTEQYLAGDMSKVYDSEALRVMGEYPIVAIPCSYTEAKPIEVDPDNVVLQNDKVITTMTPDGDYTTENETVKVEYLNSGDITITNGDCTVEIKAGGDTSVVTSGKVDVQASGDITATSSANITATASGNIEATGASAKVTAATITLEGNVTVTGTLNVGGATTAAAITGAAITGSSMGTTAGADMDDIKAKYNSHNHISSDAGNPSGPANPQI
jgi:hypothetical protein